jgi:hypothetical protein
LDEVRLYNQGINTQNDTDRMFDYLRIAKTRLYVRTGQSGINDFKHYHGRDPDIDPQSH